MDRELQNREGNQTRTFTLDRAKVDEKKRTVSVAFSSEEPVERSFGMEILDHAEGSIDLSRMEDGAPLLDSHDLGAQIGVVESVKVEGGIGRADVRFSKSARGEEVYQDVLDGIKSKISVGYSLLDSGERDEERDMGDVPAYRFKRWLPYEVSVVSVPADNSVGVGRKKENLQNGDSPQQNKTMPKASAENSAPTEVRAAAPESPAPVQISEEAVEKKILERHAGIERLAKDWNLPASVVEEAKRNRTSVDDLGRAIASKEIEVNPAPAIAPDLGLNEKEKRTYSFASALRSLVNNRPVEGLEREVSDAIAERCGRDTAGFFMATPGDLRHGRRDLTAGTATDGAELVDEQLRPNDFVDVLRPNMVTGTLGVRMLTGLVGNISIPRKSSASAAGWAGDEVTTAHSESEPQFNSIDLTPHPLGCFTDVSKTLLHQATPDAEMLIRDDLNQAVAIALDQAVLRGTGTGQPQGIDGATGVATSTVAVAGQPTLAELVEFETDVDTANALTSNLAWVTTPAVRGFLRQTLKTAAVSGYMWSDDNQVIGYPAYSTAQADTADIFFGNWSDYILAMWDGIDITVDPYSGAKNRLVTLILNVMADGDVRQAGSFSTNA